MLGKPFDMVKGDNGIWSFTSEPLVPGFHYYFLIIDGVQVSDPASESYNGVMADAGAFNKKVKLLWIGIGTAEPPNMYKAVNGFHMSLTEAGIKHVYYESPGTDHEWLTWRRSLNEFAPLLFK